MSEELCFVDVYIEDPGSVDVEVCKQGPTGPTGPQGPQGPAGVGEQVDFGAVAQSSNEDVDIINATFWQSVMYIITATDPAGLRKTIVVQAVVTQNSSDVEWTTYGTIGDSIDFEETLSVGGGVLTLNITNNHTDDIDISFLRFVMV